MCGLLIQSIIFKVQDEITCIIIGVLQRQTVMSEKQVSE